MLTPESMKNWFATLWVALCAGLSTPLVTKDVAIEGDRGVDPDFEGWLHGDPMVTKNPASRYGDRTPGYITDNGLGSMEIGAADD
ncbi:MAG: hypothetical protein IH606_01715 [Burkholderiales bacterium]|nr:hypothetical protein [Burkholderiales bacterium]